MLHIMLNKKSKRHYYVEKVLFFFLLQIHDFIHVCSIRKKFKCAFRAQNTQYLKVKENPQALFPIDYSNMHLREYFQIYLSSSSTFERTRT